MKYKSEILEVVHQSAIEKFKLGAITEDKMREYDKMCLASETKPSTVFNTAHETEIEHTNFATA